MAFKIYTKTGDTGQTSLFGGRRLAKSALRLEAYGTVDELNSFVGLLRDHISQEAHREVLRAIQERLFVIGSNLASDPEKDLPTPDILPADIDVLEQEMDRMDEQLPPLSNFILPGGHPTVSYSHVARCVCRRAERLVVALNEEHPVAPILLRYLNRLSDYFFVLGRMLTKDLGAEEIPWIPRG
ncbi:MAG: cob(I)yrinic acid a,c-diamide adenosyltransferase [Bacteroidota bacterium]